MPPTAKPTSVVLHRIELQKSERDMLEAAVMTNAIAKAGQAAGALLAPFAGALTAIVAAYIAREGVGDIIDIARNKLAERELALANGYAAYLAASYAALNARDEAGELIIPLDHPSRQKPPMTRSTYDKIYENEVMTNWERVQYEVAEATGGALGSPEHHDTPSTREEAEDESHELNCTLISMMFGPIGRAACRASKM